MKKSKTSHELPNASHEQVMKKIMNKVSSVGPQIYYYGVGGWLRIKLIIRLSQPSLAGDWLAGLG